MNQTALTLDLFKALQQFDTPTICNALELIVPERRNTGFTRDSLFCLDPELPPMVAVARTATIRAAAPSPHGSAASQQTRRDYYSYVAQGDLPRVIVMQDLDAEPGIGAFWGEVNSNIHRGLGCVGVITNGSIRDLDVFAEGFGALAGKVGPSHAYVHVVNFDCEVDIYGMGVANDDLIHADQHGAVVVPHDAAAKIADAVDLISRREKVILDAARGEGFTIDTLLSALSSSAEIH
jgi:regulator of RNase E activity RraA